MRLLQSISLLAFLVLVSIAGNHQAYAHDNDYKEGQYKEDTKNHKSYAKKNQKNEKTDDHKHDEKSDASDPVQN